MNKLTKKQEDYILESYRDKDYSEMTDEELENERDRIEALRDMENGK